MNNLCSYSCSFNLFTTLITRKIYFIIIQFSYFNKRPVYKFDKVIPSGLIIVQACLITTFSWAMIFNTTCLKINNGIEVFKFVIYFKTKQRKIENLKKQNTVIYMQMLFPRKLKSYNRRYVTVIIVTYELKGSTVITD